MQTYALFTQQANRFLSQNRSGIFGEHTVICKWTDQIRSLCRDNTDISEQVCYGHNVGVSNSVHWWWSFTIWRSVILLSKTATEFISDCCSLCCLTHCSASGRLCSTWVLWCTSVSLDLTSLLCVTLPVRQKMLWNLMSGCPDWDSDLNSMSCICFFCWAV